MATVPNPRTWGSTELVTAAKLNADVKDAWTYFLNRPVAILHRESATEMLISGATAVIWTDEILDTDGGHSTVTNPSRYTAQTAGWYFVRANLRWNAFNPMPTWMDLTIRKNGSNAQSRSTTVNRVNGVGCTSQVQGYVSLAVSDYLEVFAQPVVSSGRVAAGKAVIVSIEWVSV